MRVRGQCYFKKIAPTLTTVRWSAHRPPVPGVCDAAMTLRFEVTLPVKSASPSLVEAGPPAVFLPVMPPRNESRFAVVLLPVNVESVASTSSFGVVCVIPAVVSYICVSPMPYRLPYAFSLMTAFGRVHRWIGFDCASRTPSSSGSTGGPASINTTARIRCCRVRTRCCHRILP